MTKYRCPECGKEFAMTRLGFQKAILHEQEHKAAARKEGKA